MRRLSSLTLALVSCAALAQSHPTGGAEAGAAWKALRQGNARYAGGTAQQRDSAARRAQTAQAQHPRAAVLSCSDSRVPVEQVFDQGVGDLFVVRSAGEVADTAAVASLEYAVEHLGARLIVVLGHERCGAVAAAASGERFDSPHLVALMGEISPALAPLPQAERAGERGVEANVNRQAEQLLARSEVLRRAVQEGHLALRRAVYDLDTGHVRTLAPPAAATVH